MLFTNSEPSLGGPVGPALAYGKIIRNTESARGIEYRVFEDVTAALADAGLPGVAFTDRIAAVHRNRELWLALTSDVANEDNALPDSLRASIISIGIFVFREIQPRDTRVRIARRPDRNQSHGHARPAR